MYEIKKNILAKNRWIHSGGFNLRESAVLWDN